MKLFSRKKTPGPLPVARTLERRKATVRPRLRRLEKAKKLDDPESRQRLLRIGRWLFAFAFVCAVVYMLIWSPYVQVNRVVVTGVPADIGRRVEALVGNDLSGSGWGRIPRRSFFLIRENSLGKDVARALPEVRSVRIVKQFPQTVTLVVEMRGPVLVMCSGGPCFAVDEAGMVIGNEDSLDPDFPRVRVVDTSAAPIDFSEPVVTADFIGFALRVRQAVSERLGIGVSGDIMTPSRLSGAVDIGTDEGWRLLIDSHNSLSGTLDNLALFLSRQIKNDTDRKRLEYVDARTENRIYYRFVGDTVVTADQKPPDIAPPPAASPEKPQKKGKK